MKLPRFERDQIKNYILGLFNVFLLLVAETGLALVANSFGLGKECLSMSFLIGVIMTALVTGGYTMGCLNAVCSFLVINYLFTDPYFGFSISYRDDLILLLTFLITAMITGIVSSNLREQRNRAEKNERAAQELVRVSREEEKMRLAMEQEKLRTTLLRSVAHDLRSPLTALSGTSRLLEDDYENLPEEERRALIANMAEETLWLTAQVENILNMTRIGEGKLVLKREYEAVDDVLNEAMTRMERLLRGHAVEVNLPEEILMAPMDGHLIVRVLLNLLENAVRHTPPDSAITLSAERKGDDVEFSVADTGNGIPEGIRANLFDSYVTVETVVIDGKCGIGLGLAICRAIVEAHGGAISVEDNPPHGTRFSFTLPLEENADGSKAENFDH